MLLVTGKNSEVNKLIIMMVHYQLQNCRLNLQDLGRSLPYTGFKCQGET